MPLSKPLQELLATIKDEDDRKILTEKFEKYEPIQEHFAGNLRQQDYDAKMNASKKEVQDAVEKATKWQKWADDNVPRHQTLMDEWKATRTKNEELEKQVKEVSDKLALAGTGGEDMTEEQLKKVQDAVEGRIAGRGFVSKTELSGIINQELTKVAHDEAIKIADERVALLNKETLPAWGMYITKQVGLQFRHRDEFGKPMDDQAFAKYIVDNKLNVQSAQDLDKAFESFTAEDRNKLKETKMREEIEKDVRTKMNVPGTGASPTPELGAVEAMRRGTKEAAIPEGAIPGTGALAAAAAAELRAEGKA